LLRLIRRFRRGASAKRMDNEAIAHRFNRLADLMEIRGDDAFRIRSYRNAADMIETWPTPMQEIARDGGAKALQEIPGVGKAISGKIIELVEKGTFEAWEKLTAETPETVLDLLSVGGVGRKTAATLHQKFKIASLDDLKKFVAGGGLELVDGIGEKSAERIRKSLGISE
jgi:DNA polymerase (family 10)